MKHYLLAAAAMIAVPAFAQTGTTDTSTGVGSAAGTPQTTTESPTTMSGQTMEGQTGTTPTDPAQTGTTPPADSTMTQPGDPAATGTAGSTSQTMTNDPAMQAPPAQGQTMPGSTDTMSTAGTMPSGTGTPTMAPMGTGSMMGGAGVAATTAEPAPAALASYPPCRAGQFDDCVQTAARSSRSRARRRR